MTASSKIPWARLFAEAVAIVASILLAFAIDAWWDERAEQQHEMRLLAGLLDDFEASQEMAGMYLEGNRRVQQNLVSFIQEIRDTPAGEQIPLNHGWITAAISGPTYSPIDATLRAAMSSGDIALIRDEALRHSLVQWRQVLADTTEDEILIRQIVLEQVVPALSTEARLAGQFDNTRMVAFFRGEEVSWDSAEQTITVTPELEAAIAHRLFYTGFVVNGMQEIETLQDELMKMIRQSLGATGAN